MPNRGLRATRPQFASANSSCRVAAFGRWPPQAGKSVSMKGGGQPSAALTVGSRAVGKRKTLNGVGWTTSGTSGNAVGRADDGAMASEWYEKGSISRHPFALPPRSPRCPNWRLPARSPRCPESRSRPGRPAARIGAPARSPRCPASPSSPRARHRAPAPHAFVPRFRSRPAGCAVLTVPCSVPFPSSPAALALA